MPLQLAPLEKDDLHEYVRILFAAFDLTPFGRVLTPTLTPERINDSYQQSLKALESPDCRLFKVVDTDTGKIISCSKWKIWTKERTQEELDKDVIKPTTYPDANVEGERDFFAFLNDSRREYMGNKPFFFLNILVTDPEHHRRGAGTIHMQWGIEEAARLGLPMYLEASKFGRPLYERVGYKVDKVVTFDLDKYGAGPGIEEQCCMLRDTERMS